MPEKDYEDIPGTFVFDADRSREGYHLNQFCISLRLQKNRDAFNADEEKYLDNYPMTPEQRDAVLKREWNRLLELGGGLLEERSDLRSAREGEGEEGQAA